MPETLKSPPETSIAPSPFLAAKLGALRRKQVATDALTGFAMAVGVEVELLALMMFVDWCLDLAWGARLAFLVAQLGIVGYILLRFVAAPILHPPDGDELALMVERARKN